MPAREYNERALQFLKEEILRSKSIGLNGIRVHIKVEVPRKLYWADKLGLLVVEDLPNSWGDPDKFMRNINSIPKYLPQTLITLITMFFVTLLITDTIYNIVAITLLILCIIYCYYN